MLSHGIYSVILLIFSNVFMTFAWYGHLKMRQEFSWFAALPLIGAFYFFNTTESDSYALEASWISSSLSQLVAGSVLWL